MKGLVLQGGGAKGAFQVGAIKALTERGYIFDGVVGTSIGALNAAMIAQGEFEKLYLIWENMGIDQVLDIDAEKWKKIKSKDFDKETLIYIKDLVKGFFKTGGFDTTKAKAMINKYTDEEKLRSSNMDYGLVTIKRKSDFSFEALTLFKDDIPFGKVADYIMASANFPLFAKHTIDETRYYDGGFYDNLPINMLLDKGYDDIVAIRLGDTIAPVKKPYVSNAKIMYIDPSDNIGSVLDFDQNVIKKAIKAGYYDAIRVIDDLDGKKYCIIKIEDNVFDEKMLELSESFYDYCISVFNTPIEGAKLDKYLYVSKRLCEMLKIKEGRKKAWITLIEVFADYAGIDRYQVYCINDLLKSLMEEYNHGFKFESGLKKRFLKSNTKESKSMQIMKALLKEINKEG